MLLEHRDRSYVVHFKGVLSCACLDREKAINSQQAPARGFILQKLHYGFLDLFILLSILTVYTFNFNFAV